MLVKYHNYSLRDPARHWYISGTLSILLAASVEAHASNLNSTMVQLSQSNVPSIPSGTSVSKTQTAKPQSTVVLKPTPTPFAETVDGSRRYIVLFKANANNPRALADQIMQGRGGKINFTYSTVVRGFAVTLPAAGADAFLEAMARNPLVDRVEVDQPVNLKQTTQNSATWGIDRSDQRSLPLSGSYTYNPNGSGVRVYVVDTGINASHVDFGGRVAAGYTSINDGQGTNDCNGHGTHVAGTIAGATWGIAKGAVLRPIRVLDCAGSGALSGVIAGLDWIVANAVRPAVVNMSLGAGASSTLDTATANMAAKGIVVVVAAGNSDANACDFSPAREPSAITVGSTASNDARSSFSNYGTCLDLFAPGSSIKSAWYGSTTATNTISGTSMAAPHIAGLAAQVLQATPSATPQQVADAIKAAATTGKVGSPGSGSPNLLIYTSEVSISKPAPVASTLASIGGLAGNGALVRNGWRATVAVYVKDANGNALPNAVVAASFTAGGSSVGCTTATNGSCNITSGNISKTTFETTFQVLNISGTNIVYDSTKNTISNIAVRKP